MRHERLAFRAPSPEPRAPYLLVFALALAACKPAPTTAPTALEFWAMGREGEVVQELMPEFERRSPGIRVRVQQIPWTAAHEKLLTGFVGHATPDVAQIGNTWIPELQALGALERLDPYLARSATVAPDRFFAGIWDTNVIAGGVYGVPWYVDTRLLFYRSDLLAEVGASSPPQTWTEWLEVMRRIKTRHPDRFAILLPTDEWAQPTILGMAAGAELLRDGARYGGFRAPQFRRAFDFYVGMFREGLAPVASTAQIGNVYQQFAEGYFAFYITGPWNLGEFARRLPADVVPRWAVAPMPAPDGSAAPGLSLAGGSSLTMFAASRHKQEAWRLIEYLSEPAQQKRFYTLCGDLPAGKQAWEDDPALAEPRAQAFFRQLEHVQPTPKLPEWERIATTLFQVAQEAIHGRRSNSEVLTELDRQVDDILEKRRWVLERQAKLGPR